MGKYEHTMSGFNQARKFLVHSGYRDDYLDRLESHELIYIANKQHAQAADKPTGEGIPHCSQGCHEARRFLLNTGYTVDYVDRLDGHELIFMANQLNTGTARNAKRL